MAENPGRRVDRRTFLKGAAAAAAAVMAPTLISPSALGLAGRPAPSNRITMGFIGTGGRGSGVMGGFFGVSDVQGLAVCDTDTKRREAARRRVDSQYSQAAEYKGCAAYNDFRELVARDDIDAVMVATPDHWHALITIAAAKSGKDIYCEKPLAATVAEGRAMVEAVRRYRRVLQTGSHERSNAACRMACELVRNGRLGKLHTLRVNLPAADTRIPVQPAMPIPEGFDYHTWLGPAPWAPYTEKRCHGNFRWIMDYSDGELTDRGAHVGDIGLWGAGPFLKGPVQIEGRGEFPRDGLWNTSYAYHIEHTYASGVRILVTDQEPRGVKFEGSDGWLFVHIHGGAMEAEPKSILREPIGANEVHLKPSPGHHVDFLNCVKDRSDPVALVEGGHATAALCHTGLIAILLGRKVVWDPEREQFVNDPEATAMTWRPMREPWRL